MSMASSQGKMNVAGLAGGEKKYTPNDVRELLNRMSRHRDEDAAALEKHFEIFIARLKSEGLTDANDLSLAAISFKIGFQDGARAARNNP